MSVFSIHAAPTPICEKNISLEANATKELLLAYQLTGDPITQSETFNQEESIGEYNLTPSESSRTSWHARPLRWTKSGNIVPSTFDVHYRKLGDLSLLTLNWDGCDTPCPTPLCVRHAKQTLEILADLNFEPNGLVPGGEGGIAFTFRRVGKYADIEIFNDGEAMMTLHTRDGHSKPLIEDLDLTKAALQAAVERIINFLR